MTTTLTAPPFAGYDTWRPGQLETVEAVRASRSRFCLVNAPTGAGKSLIAAALVEPVNGVILTGTKQLQDQYGADFPDFAELRGIANYPCAAVTAPWSTRPKAVEDRIRRMHEGRVPNNAKTAPCHDAPWKPWREEETIRTAGGHPVRVEGRWVDPCPLSHDGCAYIAAREAVSRADRPAVLNYHVWAALGSLDAPRWPIPTPRVLVCDEAHALETLICDLVAVTLEKGDCDILRDGANVDVDLLRAAPDENEAREVATAILKSLDDEGPPVLDGLDMGTDEILGTATPGKRLRRALERLGAIARLDTERWAWEPESLTAAPLRAIGYADVVWSAGVDRIVLMSATATLRTVASITSEQVEVVPVSAPVAEERRLVKVPKDAPALNYRNLDEHLPWVADRIAAIAADNPLAAGVIHCHSYRMRDQLVDRLPESVRARLVMHDRGGLQEAMRRHADWSADSWGDGAPILISPTATTGVDFPGEMARWQVVARFPWPSFGSRIVKRRADDDPEWPLRTACSTLAQTIGRGVRSADDWCETWILDGTVMKARVRYALADYLPDYVRSAFRRVM